MLAIQCPFCQHENTPGARFCADCGSPLHLKPCPKCGKVDDVAVKLCAGCGMVFPPIALAHGGEVIDPNGADAAGKAAAEAAALGRRASDKAVSNRALPLVLVAVVAGGLPLLWMNRAYLPLPAAWRIQGPNAAGSAVAPSPAPTSSPPPAAAPAPVATPEPAAPAAPPAAPAGNAVEPESEPKPAADAAARAADPPKKTAAAPQKQKDKPPPKAQTAKPRQDAAQPAAAPRPCTEAVQALGLCDPKRDPK
jgi:hypothetical protein